MPEHLLSTLIGLPLLGGVLIALLPPGSQRGARMAALLVALANLSLSLFLLREVGIGPAVSGAGSRMVWLAQEGPAGFKFHEDYPWISPLGITYSLGVDGISLFLVLLVTCFSPLAVLSGWNSIRSRPRGFYATLSLLQSGMIGALCARDAFLFYLFWEVMLLPMFFLIGLWGRTPGRVFATVKFVIYTLAGSLIMLLALIYMYVRHHDLTGVWSFAITDWYGLGLAPQEQMWLFWGFVIAFAVKIPIVPLHTWLPDAYVEAPTPAVFMLSGVMAKLGAYGLIRFALPLFPQAAAAGVPVLRILAIIGIVYGACIALVQTDIKRLIAYSSISHLGLVVLGISAANIQGLQGALFQMVSHALSTGTLFLLAGMLEERYGTTQIEEFGGLAPTIPWLATALLITVLSSAGLPGLNGFVGEFLILLGAFRANPATATIATSGMIWVACYLLWFYQRTIFGPAAGDPRQHPAAVPSPGGPAGLPPRPVSDLSPREWLIVVPVIVLMVGLGVAPRQLLDRTAPVAQRWVHTVVVPPIPLPPGKKHQ